MMHIRNPKNPPSSAEIISKLGTAIERITASRAINILKKAFIDRVNTLDWFKRFGLRSAARESTPVNTSRVETIGAALSNKSAVILVTSRRAKHLL